MIFCIALSLSVIPEGLVPLSGDDTEDWNVFSGDRAPIPEYSNIGLVTIYSDNFVYSPIYTF